MCALDPSTPLRLAASLSLADLKKGIRRASRTGWNGMRVLLGVLKETSDVFPPLKAAVGGLLALLDLYEVRIRTLFYLRVHSDLCYLSVRSRMRLECTTSCDVLIGS